MLKRFVRRHPVKTQRFLEILPGFTSWSLILFPLWGSFLIPEIVAYYIIAFDVYWLYRSLPMAILAIIAHFKIRASVVYDWFRDVKKLEHWKKMKHIIIIPTYKEPLTTLERTLNTLTNQTFPLKQLFITLSFEEREGEDAKHKAKILLKQFGDTFGNLWVTYHPDIHGEVKGKSSNTSWGAKVAKQKLIAEQNADIDYVTITSEDADALFHPHYFSALTYEFLTNPKRYNRIWQPSIMFYNNIWKVAK